MNRKRVWIILVAILLSAWFIFVLSRSKTKDDDDPRGTAYSGAAACVSCHPSIHKAYIHTAHFLAAIPSSEDSILQNLSGDGVFVVNDSQKIAIEKRDKRLFQTSYHHQSLVEQHSFDITLGGIKGGSYLYWNEDQLFQLPLSYSTVHQRWISSPGYDANKIDFGRQIGKRCFECHASFIRDDPYKTASFSQGEILDRNSLVYGIDCERCHGPAASHVKFHRDNPLVKEPMYVIKYHELSREQKIDACAICHSGNSRSMLRSTFAFKPGDTLARFELPDFSSKPQDSSSLDVHGNQVQLLASSRCFKNSNMDCSTCHRVHEKERDKKLLYAERCMSCHTSSVAHAKVCKMTDRLSAVDLKNNCIQCHMPALPSRSIVVRTSGAGTLIPFTVRTHRIAVYNNEVERIVAYLAKIPK